MDEETDVTTPVREALAAVFDGATDREADALLDALEDRGYRVVAS